MSHLGKNISSLRNFRRIPQKDMAARLQISQQEYSRMESKEEIDEEWLNRIATILDFPVEAIKNMDSAATFQTVYQQTGNNGNGFYVNSNEKVIEMYERLLKEKDAVIEMQKGMIEMYKENKKS